MCNKNKAELFKLINEYSFMLDDITLYLNTHPNCQKGLNEYEKYKALRNEVMAEYEANYGPICKYNVDINNSWDWINQPWPWEGECNR